MRSRILYIETYRSRALFDPTPCVKVLGPRRRVRTTLGVFVLCVLLNGVVLRRDLFSIRGPWTQPGIGCRRRPTTAFHTHLRRLDGSRCICTIEKFGVGSEPDHTFTLTASTPRRCTPYGVGVCHFAVIGLLQHSNRPYGIYTTSVMSRPGNFHQVREPGPDHTLASGESARRRRRIT